MELHRLILSEQTSEAPSEREISEQIDALVRTRAREATKRGILERKEKLFSGKHIDTVDPTVLQQQIDAAFDALYALPKPGPAETSDTPEARTVLRWMRLAKTLRINTLADWSVSREQPEERLGLESFGALEGVLSERYGTEGLRHFHQGSGNNILVERGNKRSHPQPGNKTWKHIGFGDCLYAAIDNIKRRYVRPEMNDGGSKEEVVTGILRVLTEALQRKLHKLWFSDAILARQAWRASENVQDLNAMFGFLAEPNELLEGVHISEENDRVCGTVSLSHQFVGDHTETIDQLSQWTDVSAEIHAWLLGIQGMSSLKIEHKILAKQKMGLIRRRDKIKRILAEISPSLDIAGDAEAMIAWNRQTLSVETRKIVGTYIPLTDVQTNGDLINKCNTLALEVRAKLSRVKLTANACELITKKRDEGLHDGLLKGITLLLQEVPLRGETEEVQLGRNANVGEILAEIAKRIPLPSSDTEPKKLGDLLRQIFTEEFVASVERPKSPSVDLNENLALSAFPRDFILGDFGDMGSMFPKSSCMLISGIRSHSHASDKDFYATVRENLALLKPGGVFITDGIEESYTEVLRLIGSLENYAVRIIMDGKTHMPLSLFIQRKPDKGEYLDETDVLCCCKEGAYVKTPEEISKLRPDIHIIQGVRKAMRTTLETKEFLPINRGKFLCVTNPNPTESSELQKRLVRETGSQILLAHQEWITPDFIRYLWERCQHRFETKVKLEDKAGEKLNFTPLESIEHWEQKFMGKMQGRQLEEMARIPLNYVTFRNIIPGNVLGYWATLGDHSERAVSDAIACASWRAENGHTTWDIPKTDALRTKTAFLNRGRNIGYEELPLLPPERVHLMTQRTIKELTECTLRKHQAR